jgi:hypothetical protein
MLLCAPGNATDALDQCISAAKRANIRCWDACGGDQDCNDRCDSKYETAKKNCANPEATASAVPGKRLSGVKQNGQDGCYFGECPDDLQKKIDDAKKVPEQPPDESPASPPASTAPPKRRRSDNPTQPFTPTVPITNVCQTPAFWCIMIQYGPVNSPCWCANMFGVAQGVTIAVR